jgi:hypothetical protein
MKLNTLRSVALAITLTLTAATRAADLGPATAAVLKAFGGAATYSHCTGFSDAIPELFLAYDQAGAVVAGAALRSFKTYELVTSLVVVRKENGKYVITEAAIPDIAKVKDPQKQEKVLSAIKGSAGRVVRDETGNWVKVDAVTGATRYQQRIYASFDMMAKKIVEQIEAKPTWERQPLPAAGKE